MPDAGCLPRSGLPGEELQEDLLKNTEDDSDARGKKARRNPPENKRCRVGGCEPAWQGLEHCYQGPGKKGKPDDEGYQDCKGHPLPAPRVDLLDDQRRREERGREEQDVEEDPQGVHNAKLRVTPLDVKRCEVDHLL